MGQCPKLAHCRRKTVCPLAYRSYKIAAMPRAIMKRFASDDATRLRLHYSPYYQTFDRQQGTTVWLKGKPYVMLSSNDYLGLCWHPQVIQAGQKALAEWGSSPTGSRMANGSRAYHTQLEEELAAFLGKERAHVFSAGYLACMAAVYAFAQKGDLILADRNLHSSLLSGIGLTQSEVVRFAHNSADDLRSIISAEPPQRPKLLVMEGVFSMEGHLAPLPELLSTIDPASTLTILDDAHGLGVMGPQGRGTPAHFGLSDRIDIITGSLSKSLSSVGGYIAGSATLIEYLRTHAKPLIFSAAIPPAQAACALASLRLMQTEPEHLERLWANTRRYHELLRSLGFDIWQTQTPATPIVIGNREKAYLFWRKLMEQGIFTVMSVAPAVPQGKDLIRTAISAAHTDADFALIEKALKEAKKVL
jgi:8-amino-7-oxononanoate synthase